MSARHVLELCDQWDRLSKGESPTTAAIRQALAQPDGSIPPPPPPPPPGKNPAARPGHLASRGR